MVILTKTKNEINVLILDASDDVVSITEKKRFGGKKSSHKIDYETHNIASNIIGENVNISSKKDVNILGSNIKAEEEKNKLSNSSSSSGVSASISLDETPLSATISTSGNKGRANGTSYVNSIINVGGNLKTESKSSQFQALM